MQHYEQAFAYLASHSSFIQPQELKRLASRIHRIATRSCPLLCVRVAFSGFWRGFNPVSNELLSFSEYCLSSVGVNIEVVDKNADILFLSCFGPTTVDKNKNPSATVVLFLGENVRPAYSGVDYSLSFELDSFLGKNLYFPLWILRLSPWALYDNSYSPIPIDILTQPSRILSRNDSICFIGNNQTPFRESVLHILRNLGYSVDVFGAMTRPVENKHKHLSEYRYSIAIENSYTPGYVTEKLFDSYVSGTIPIYWGGLPPALFNPLSFFNIDVSCDSLFSLSDLRAFSSVNLLPPLIAQDKLSSFLSEKTSWLRRVLLN